MNTQVATAELPRAGRRLRRSPRLVGAELLKLRKRRGLVLATLALTVVPMLVHHAIFAGDGGYVGGTRSFVGAMDLLWGMSLIAAILVGATLGTGDLGAGVFRELVVTGRSRLALFAARIPAGLALLAVVVGAGFAATAAISTAFAGSGQTGYAPGHHGDPGAFVLGDAAPSATLLLESAAWLGLVAGVSMLVALGVSSLFSSRGTSIGVLLGGFLLVMPLLLEASDRLGWARYGIFYGAADRLKPETLLAGATPGVSMSVTTALVALLAWTLVPLAAGAWRTCTRDA